MVWTSIFVIGIVQGIFLILLIWIRSARNRLAAIFINILLVLMVLINLGYLVIRTDLVAYVPQLFGVPFGAMFLFGPLFYFYSKSVIENDFKWKATNWLHFIPYLLHLIRNIPMLTMDKGNWQLFIGEFMAGNLPIGNFEKALFAIQDFQLLIYLIITFRYIGKAKSSHGNLQFIVTINSRIIWLKQVANALAMFLFVVVSLYVIMMFHGKYNPITNYVYTLVTSGIIYFIAYKLVLNPELISPDFIRKYRTYVQFADEKSENYIQKLSALLNHEKIFLNSELSLSTLANQLGLPSHQLSKLINERHSKSFNDLINEYRVKEFLARMGEAESQKYSLYGLALDVGFKSKSAFNSAFKKVTGHPPSFYKNNDDSKTLG